MNREEMKKEMRRRLDWLLAKAEREYGFQGRPSLIFKNLGCTAGRAWSTKIEIDLTLMEQDFEECLEDTLPHELAHTVCNKMHPKERGHGRDWKRVAAFLGARPTRCHDMSLRHRKPFIYKCGCPGKEWELSKRMHNDVQYRNRWRKCRTCKVKFTFSYKEGEPDFQIAAKDAPVDPDVKVKPKRPHTYECACGPIHKFTNRKHNNVRDRGKTYICRGCRQIVKFFRTDR